MKMLAYNAEASADIFSIFCISLKDLGRIPGDHAEAWIAWINSCRQSFSGCCIQFATLRGTGAQQKSLRQRGSQQHLSIFDFIYKFTIHPFFPMFLALRVAWFLCQFAGSSTLRTQGRPCTHAGGPETGQELYGRHFLELLRSKKHTNKAVLWCFMTGLMTGLMRLVLWVLKLMLFHQNSRSQPHLGRLKVSQSAWSVAKWFLGVAEVAARVVDVEISSEALSHARQSKPGLMKSWRTLVIFLDVLESLDVFRHLDLERRQGFFTMSLGGAGNAHSNWSSYQYAQASSCGWVAQSDCLWPR